MLCYVYGMVLVWVVWYDMIITVAVIYTHCMYYAEEIKVSRVSQSVYSLGRQSMKKNRVW